MQVANVNKKTNPSVQSAKAPANTAADSVKQDIQSKILNAQKQRQGLSFRTEMTSEEKENIRRKIQQEISDLKRELRQREAEEKRKQQEEQRSIERKEQQKELASQETVKERQQTQFSQSTNKQQQKTQAPQSTHDPQADDKNVRDTKQQQTHTPDSAASKKHTPSNPEGEVRELLPGGIHKIISNGSSVQQFQIVQNTSAQMDASARIREAELNLDSVRGSDRESLKKEHRQSLVKETRRRETVQGFMFGNTQKGTDPAIGLKNHTSRSARTNGLYGSNGTWFKNNFQSIQMDIKQ